MDDGIDVMPVQKRRNPWVLVGACALLLPSSPGGARRSVEGPVASPLVQSPLLCGL